MTPIVTVVTAEQMQVTRFVVGSVNAAGSTRMCFVAPAAIATVLSVTV